MRVSLVRGIRGGGSSISIRTVEGRSDRLLTSNLHGMLGLDDFADAKPVQVAAVLQYRRVEP